MAIYAHIVDGTVAELITINPGEPELAARYHAAFLENVRELKGNEVFAVKTGWKFDGGSFYQAPPPAVQPGPLYITVATVRERMEAVGKWADLVEVLKTDWPTMIKVLTLRDGIDATDPQARAMIEAAGANPDEILAP